MKIIAKYLTYIGTIILHFTKSFITFMSHVYTTRGELFLYSPIISVISRTYISLTPYLIGELLVIKVPKIQSFSAYLCTA